MPLTAQQLHLKAEEARELKQDFLTSLQLADQAAIQYQKENNLLGLSEVQSTRSNTLRHLYEQTKSKAFLTLALHAAQTAIDIAQLSNDPTALALPYHRLGSTLRLANQFKEAVETHQKAVDCMEQNPPSGHNRTAVLLDFKIHLYTCMYLAGDKQALEKAEQTVTKLAQTKEDQYNKEVWLSGGHMRITHMLQKDNPSKARQHLEQAKQIIDTNPRLKLRLQQWQKLADTF